MWASVGLYFSLRPWPSGFEVFIILSLLLNRLDLVAAGFMQHSLLACQGVFTCALRLHFVFVSI